MKADQVVQVINSTGASPVLLVCEHASNYIPTQLDGLGLTEDAKQSHAAWDIGASAVALQMSKLLDAPLVQSCVSRLVYDCNRPPEAPDAMPFKSEAFSIPGNTDLSEQDRAERAQQYYFPFRDALAAQIAGMTAPVMVTIHSFTPVYNGTPRDVEIGILHDDDTRLADAFLQTAQSHTDLRVMRNAPYGPEHGVMHTLKQHALPAGHLNVMIEIRNDLIDTPADQTQMAQLLAAWTADALQAGGVA